jgi:chemotaxis protein methyltransferase WspC
MSRDALLDLLRDRIGLDAGSLGERIVDDACAEARRTLNVADDAQLVQRMRADPSAFAAAAEHFLVGESWFFRANEQFDDLVRFARANRDRRPLRILSLPCASGEEAHSAVIRLLEAGLAPAEIEVLGIDLSEPAVLRARAGRYRASALRGQAPVAPWMHPAGDGSGGFVVDDMVRQCIHFRVGNALDDAHLRGADRFDVVFCRNLLIYLDTAARKQLLGQLRALLAAPGLLLAGQAEVVSTMHGDFLPVPTGSPLSFRLRASEDAAPTPVARVQAAVPVVINRRASAISAPIAKPAPAPAPPAPPVDVLAQARALADAGQLADALASCTRWLDVHPADSEALFLFGLLESALGHFDAADQAFTRVLYVDRDHADALAQRIGLAERFGRTDQARDLRARAARLRARQQVKP